MRRYITHCNYRDTADVHTHFHGSGTAQQIQLTLLKVSLVAVELLLRLLSRVLGRTKIVAALDYKISNVRPQAFLAELDDLRFAFTPVPQRP
ncbi:hypothetical protein D3C81_1953880 [compost metagenome]